jgi:prolyl-tRNA synthetase
MGAMTATTATPLRLLPGFLTTKAIQVIFYKAILEPCMGEEQGITVKKGDDPAEWYQQVVLKGGFADYTSVKGCIVIREWGYGIWELVQEYWDARMKEHGTKNVYFPLFIPESLLKKEAEHFKGFTPEVAWVTMAGDKELEERLAIRPTSETIMYDMFSKWITSHRDLPLRLNQWCNVVRWETKMTKPFLRGREFLWHEEHTVHSTKEEANVETRWGIDGYAKLAEELLAIPVVTGRKTDSDKFAGADYTLSCEAFMPDGKALQMGTSHMLGQNFAKPYGVKFLGLDEKWHHAWQTSLGASTRMLGGVILMHGDDRGAIIPPRVAPVQVVIVPILFKGKEAGVLKSCKAVETALLKAGVRAHFDGREEYTAGWKFNNWEMKGVPLRIEVGPRDVAKGEAVLARRDKSHKETVKQEGIAGTVKARLEEIQADLLTKARKRLKDSTVTAVTPAELKGALDSGKWAVVPHCGDPACEEAMAKKFEGGPRVIPKQPAPAKKCVGCGKKAGYWVYWGRSY